MLSSAAGHLRAAQGQAVAWLQKVVLTLVPGSAAQGGTMDEKRG
jgi:hypothetical protein